MARYRTDSTARHSALQQNATLSNPTVRNTGQHLFLRCVCCAENKKKTLRHAPRWPTHVRTAKERAAAQLLVFFPRALRQPAKFGSSKFRSRTNRACTQRSCIRCAVSVIVLWRHHRHRPLNTVQSSADPPTSLFDSAV